MKKIAFIVATILLSTMIQPAHAVAQDDNDESYEVITPDPDQCLSNFMITKPFPIALSRLKQEPGKKNAGEFAGYCDITPEDISEKYNVTKIMTTKTSFELKIQDTAVNVKLSIDKNNHVIVTGYVKDTANISISISDCIRQIVGKIGNLKLQLTEK